jgi:hypothetical protein
MYIQVRLFVCTQTSALKILAVGVCVPCVHTADCKCLLVVSPVVRLNVDGRIIIKWILQDQGV